MINRKKMGGRLVVFTCIVNLPPKLYDLLLLFSFDESDLSVTLNAFLRFVKQF
jgi:hypothetical protein